MTHRSSDTGRSIYKTPGTAAQSGNDLGFHAVRPAIHLEVDDPAELRPILQGSRAPHDLYPIQYLRRRRIVAFGITQCISAEIIAILTRVKLR